MSMQSILEVIGNLFSKLSAAIDPGASQLVQFDAGELHKLKAAYDNVKANPIVEAVAPIVEHAVVEAAATAIDAQTHTAIATDVAPLAEAVVTDLLHTEQAPAQDSNHADE